MIGLPVHLWPRASGAFFFPTKKQKFNKPPLENLPSRGMYRAGGLSTLYPLLNELAPVETIPQENHNAADCLRLIAQRMMSQQWALISDED